MPPRKHNQHKPNAYAFNGISITIIARSKIEQIRVKHQRFTTATIYTVRT